MEYSYDPWGNIEYHLADDVTEEEAMVYTALCPLTYRGYNYDFTTGLYYLQSRYYNPEWGRFLNCDDTAILLSTKGETHNANLFAYCVNNPVNRVDYDGRVALNIPNKTVKVNIYSGLVGHAEICIGPLVFSYGVYGGGYNYIDKVIGCPADLIVVLNNRAWETYDIAHKKRYPEHIYIAVNNQEFIALLIFYCSIVLCSDNIEYRDHIGGEEVIDCNNIKQADWLRCNLNSGQYKTYRLLYCNCVIVVDNALQFAMPERYEMALKRAVIYNPTGKAPFVMNPSQFGDFLRLYFK